MKSAFLHEESSRKALASFVLSTQRLSMGEQCARFEEEFAAFQGRTHAVLVHSGGCANLALLQALLNLGRLAPGDRVGFSSLTWATNVMPLLQLGLVPVPIDCHPPTLNAMSHNLEERLQTTHMDAMFATNVLGFTGDMSNIRRLCESRGILLLEDNCEALGTELPAGKAGNFGLAATFSFFVAHHISTIEGGMVCTDDDNLANMLRMVRANGWDRNLTSDQQSLLRERHQVHDEFQAKYTFYDLAYNIRPTELTGLMGITQLMHVDEAIRARIRTYESLSRTVGDNPDLLPQQVDHISRLSNFAFPIVGRTRKVRDEYFERFVNAGIEIRPIISGNMQAQPFYRKHVREAYDLPGTQMLHECGFYCGNCPDYTKEEIHTINQCLVKV